MTEFLNQTEIKVFKKLIDGYQMSVSARNTFVDSKFAVIAGPAGAGKDTIRNKLIKKYPTKYDFVLSTTTRPARRGEKDGLDYHFRSREEVKRALEEGEFFQSALVHNQQVSCLHISEIEKLGSKVGLSILIVQAEQEMRKTKPNIKTIFLIPPSLNELKKRMKNNRDIQEGEMNRRLVAAIKELEIAMSQDEYYCLVYDEIESITEVIDNYFSFGQIDTDADKKARTTIKKIFNDLKHVK